MNRLSAFALCFILVVGISCSFMKKKSATTENTNTSQKTTNLSTPAPDATATPETTQAATSSDGDLQPGQASGSFTARGVTVELKYAYAGHAKRFGEESLIVLLTEKPIPADAVDEELDSTPLLEGEQLRGLEYMLSDESMWIRFHPTQYQESTSNKLKDYKVEGDIVRGIDENDGSLYEGKYKRSVRFVARIQK